MDNGTLNCNEVHLHITGSISAALVPWWIHWLRHQNENLVVNVSVTPSASRFVTREALVRLVNGAVWEDTWESLTTPVEVNFGRSGSSECFIIFPATLDTLMRLSHGRADSPALMMLQLTESPIVIADTLPGSNGLVEQYLDVLRERSNVRFAPRVVGVRSVNRDTKEVGFNLPGAISIANQMLKERGSPE